MKLSLSCLFFFFFFVISGVGHHLQASKYLSQAQWIVLRTPDCSAAVQHRLHRSLGLLCAAEGNFEQALYHLANDVSQLKYSNTSIFLPSLAFPDPIENLSRQFFGTDLKYHKSTC